LLLLNAGTPNFLLQFLGHTSLILGFILQWWGLQAFYRKRPSISGWYLFVVFTFFAAVLVLKGTVTDRAALLGCGVLVILSMCFCEVWRNHPSRRTFASRLTLFTLAGMIMGHFIRLMIILTGNMDILPASRTSFGVIFIFLMPLVGTLMYATAILLLYFERIIEDNHYLATHDELTGILNRRAIVAGGERELDLAIRLQRPFCVAFIDIDFFKKINDELGHEAGDVVIAGIAQALKKACRSIDLVGRYGGEEFCIIFPNLDSKNALLVGERIMTEVRDYRFNDVHGATVSIGIASLNTGTPGHTWQSLIKRADAELYKAKTSGRNKFCFSCVNDDEGAQAARNQLPGDADVVVTATGNLAIQE
jgi:diguanylate cyclase (GGDEF)-like protein